MIARVKVRESHTQKQRALWRNNAEKAKPSIPVESATWTSAGRTGTQAPGTRMKGWGHAGLTTLAGSESGM